MIEDGQLIKRLNKCKLEIEKIDKSLKTNGGLNCGWPQDDHQDFLKLKTKMKMDVKDVAFFEICV